MPAAAPAPLDRPIQIFRTPTVLGGELVGELRDANATLGNRAAMHERLAEDGYLLLRSVIPREPILAARREVMLLLQAAGQLALGSDPMDGIAAPEAMGLSPHDRSFSSGPAFRRVVEGPEIFGLFETLLGGPVLTYEEKWLRVSRPACFTGAHLDIVYMGRGTQELYTCWIPYGDVPVAMGPLAILPQSHRHPALAQVRATYGRSDYDTDGYDGWFSTDAAEFVRAGLRWGSTDFAAGDVILFGMQLMHGSLANTTDRIRLSSDTRYQRADQPVDPRWYGPGASGHARPATPRTMAEMRRQWNLPMPLA